MLPPKVLKHCPLRPFWANSRQPRLGNIYIDSITSSAKKAIALAVLANNPIAPADRNVSVESQTLLLLVNRNVVLHHAKCEESRVR